MGLKNGTLEQHRWSMMTLAKFENPKVIVTVEGFRSEKTLSQLGYLFGQVYPLIAEHTGHSVNYLHYHIFTPLFVSKVVTKWRGRDVISQGRFSEGSKGEVSEFIERVIAEAADMGIVVPPADPSKSTKRLDI